MINQPPVKVFDYEINLTIDSDKRMVAENGQPTRPAAHGRAAFTFA